MTSPTPASKGAPTRAPTAAPTHDPRPISIGDGPRGAVLLHGLTGTPWEVGPFAEALAARDISVRAPLLAGHDTLEALEHTTWRQWYDDAQACFDTLRDGGRRKVIVVGFSMGSLLALRLAALRPREVAGIVALSVPLSLPPWQARAIEALAGLRRNRWLGGLVGALPKFGADVRIAEPGQASPSLPSFPFPALAQLVELQQEVDGLLELVRAPVLLVHGRYDHSAPTRLSARVSQRVASSEVTRIVLENSFHIVGRDLDADRASDEIVAFAERHLGATDPEPPARST